MISFLKSKGVIELWSDVEVNDGGWHKVRVQFNPSYMSFQKFYCQIVPVKFHVKSQRGFLQQ